MTGRAILLDGRLGFGFLKTKKLERVADLTSDQERNREDRVSRARLQHDSLQKCYAIYLDVEWVTSVAWMRCARPFVLQSKLRLTKGALRIYDPTLDFNFGSLCHFPKCLSKLREIEIS